MRSPDPELRGRVRRARILHRLRAAVGMESEHGQLSWISHGDYILKGVEESVEVFEVGVTDIGPLMAPPDTEKARRSPRST